MLGHSRSRRGMVAGAGDPLKRTGSMLSTIAAAPAKKQHQNQGNALIELGKKVQQLRHAQNEIEMEKAESRLMKLHLTIVITTVINFISAIIEQETSWRSWYLSDRFPGPDTRQSSESANTLKIITSVVTVILECMLVYMYILFNQLRISKSEIESKLGNSLKDSQISVLLELFKGLPYHPEAVTRWHPNWLLFIEMMVFAVHPFPYVHGTFQLEVLGIKSVYQIEQVLLVCMFSRFYTLVRYLREREAVQMRPFRKLLNGYGMVISTKALVKRFINLYPFRFVLMIYAVNYIINIYCLRMSDIAVVSRTGQKTTSAAIVEITTQPMYIWNNMWMIQSSISTVGYGDQYPFTHFGRFFVLAAVFLQIGIDSFTVATMNAKTSMSLIESTITKQLSLMTMKRNTKNVAARMIYRWWRYHRVRLTLHDRKHHIYGRGYGHNNSSASTTFSDAEVMIQRKFARLKMQIAEFQLKAHFHAITKLKRPTEGGDTEMIFAALSGTFDHKFEIFFSNLSSVVNAVAGPRGDFASGAKFDSNAAENSKNIVVRPLLSERLTKMAFERVGVNMNRIRPLSNCNVSPFLKAESQISSESPLGIKTVLANIEHRLIRLEAGIGLLEKRAMAKKVGSVAVQWARKELQESLSEFSTFCHLPRTDLPAAPAADTFALNPLPIDSQGVLVTSKQPVAPEAFSGLENSSKPPQSPQLNALPRQRVISSATSPASSPLNVTTTQERRPLSVALPAHTTSMRASAALPLASANATASVKKPDKVVISAFKAR